MATRVPEGTWTATTGRAKDMSLERHSNSKQTARSPVNRDDSSCPAGGMVQGPPPTPQENSWGNRLVGLVLSGLGDNGIRTGVASRVGRDSSQHAWGRSPKPPLSLVEKRPV